jgi:polar amino acid transport system substrate-binding protein
MRTWNKVLLLGTMVLALGLFLYSPGMAQDKPLVVGVDGTFAPHAMPKIGGGVEGFNVDLAMEIGRRMGRKVDIVAQEFSGLIPGMNAGKFDFLAAPTTVLPDRAKNLLFTEGYLETDYQFVIPINKPDMKVLEDLKGKVVTVNKGSNYEMWCRENEAKYGFKTESYGTNTDAVQAVLSGRADANLAGHTVSAFAVKLNQQQLKLSYKIKSGTVWAIPLRKDDVKNRKIVEEAIECIKLDGTMAKMAEKWFGVKPDPGSPAVTVYPGYGVQGYDGYDPTEHKPNCK